MPKSLRPETIALRSTFLLDKNAGSVGTPIYPSTNFEREADGSYQYDYIYSRLDNPNRVSLERSLAILEHGEAALAFSSGMAATSAVFQTLKAGDHVIITDDAYYSTIQLAREVFGKLDIEITTLNLSDIEMVKRSLKKSTRLLWVETPSNPQLKVYDIKALATIAHEVGALCVVDNTWATPILQNPLSLGADISMHSTTKYLGGHGDVTGGALVLKEKGEVYGLLKRIQQLSGAVPSPFDCWLISRGIKTLHVRLKEQMTNAYQLAGYLEAHPKIEKVHYPGLESHLQYDIAKQQMYGFGAMLSVQVKGNGDAALGITGKLKLFTIATSLGGVESLVEHRKSIEGPDSPTPNNLLRLSIGLEHIDDLKEDWDQALTST